MPARSVGGISHLFVANNYSRGGTFLKRLGRCFNKSLQPDFRGGANAGFIFVLLLFQQAALLSGREGHLFGGPQLFLFAPSVPYWVGPGFSE